MPATWVVCPIIIQNGANIAKVLTLIDPGRPLWPTTDDTGLPILVPQYYSGSCCIYPERGMDWALCYVAGVDFSAIDIDPDCERVFDEVIPDEESGRLPTKERCALWYEGTPQASIVALRILQRLNINPAGLEAGSKRRNWLTRLGIAASGGELFRLEGWHIA